MTKLRLTQQDIFQYLKIAGLAVLMFYIIYPQALAVMGSSVLIVLGGAGVVLYVYKGFPFIRQVFFALLGFAILFFFAWNSASIHGVYDMYIRSITNSQMGWFFAAFLFNYCFFKVHEKPSFNLLLRYVALAIILQSIITVIMHFNQDVNDYLYSLQLQTEMTDEDRARFETERLMGYGTGLFGAGIISGYGLIVITFLICREKMNWIQLIIAGGLYTFVFYIGLFSARTALIGFGMSLVLICLLALFDDKTQKKQSMWLGGIVLIMTVLGMSLAYYYFPDFSEWAFEAYYNYQNEGILFTKSSGGLYFMFYAPDNLETLLWGTGSFEFFGSDVGYTRLMFYIGVPGMLMYFLYSLNIMRLSLVKDVIINLFVLYLFAYNLGMNVKGFTDLNVLFCLFFFFFLFYKQKIYNPKLITYRNNLIGQKT